MDRETSPRDLVLTLLRKSRGQTTPEEALACIEKAELLIEKHWAEPEVTRRFGPMSGRI